MSDYLHAETTGKIIGCAIRVHRLLGPGLLESPYEEALAIEFEAEKIRFERQPRVGAYYKDQPLDLVFIPDFIVEDKVVVEVKARAALNDNMKAQVLTYLKITGCPVGLLFNFHEERLYRGIKRLIFTPSES